MCLEENTSTHCDEVGRPGVSGIQLEAWHFTCLFPCNVTLNTYWHQLSVPSNWTGLLLAWEHPSHSNDVPEIREDSRRASDGKANTGAVGGALPFLWCWSVGLPRVLPY